MKNVEINNFEIAELVEKVAQWHHARNLIDGSTDQAQFVKLTEELGELAGNISRNRDVRDDISDIIIVLINIAERNGYSLSECLQVGWNEIKDRKGEMRNGIWVKEADL